jgi:hypothetical protein
MPKPVMAELYAVRQSQEMSFDIAEAVLRLLASKASA